MEKDEIRIIKDYEIIFMVLIFSSIFYFLFPKKTIIHYAINEKSNIELAEVYLKNTHAKYPDRLDIAIALCEVYIKNYRYQEAEKIIDNLNRLQENSKPFVFYKMRLKIFSINEKTNEFEIEKIINFIINNVDKTSDINLSTDKTHILFILAEKLFYTGRHKKGVELLKEYFKKTQEQKVKKEILIKYIEFLRKYNIISSYVSETEIFEEVALKDPQLSYELIKFYLESGKPYKASSFAEKVMKVIM